MLCLTFNSRRIQYCTSFFQMTKVMSSNKVSLLSWYWSITINIIPFDITHISSYIPTLFFNIIYPLIFPLNIERAQTNLVLNTSSISVLQSSFVLFKVKLQEWCHRRQDGKDHISLNPYVMFCAQMDKNYRYIQFWKN